MALPAALGFLALLDLVVVAAFFAVRGERRGMDLRLADAALTAAADDALYRELDAWSPRARGGMRVGDVDSMRATVAEPLVTEVTTRTTRLSESLFSLVADARVAGDSAARRRASVVVRVPSMAVDGAALASTADPVLATDVALFADPGDTAHGCARRRVPVSAPVLRVDDTTALLTLGADDWRSLAARADLRIAPGASHDADLPPLTYAAGDLELRGGAGSGVLLVEGRLSLAGPLTFTGLAIARGGVRTTSDSGSVEGLVLSFGPVDLQHRLELRASRCAVRRVLAAVLRPLVAPGRGWAELF